MNARMRVFGGFFELSRVARTGKAELRHETHGRGFRGGRVMSGRRALAGLLGALVVAMSGWGVSVSSAGAASSYISVQYEPNGVSPATNVGLVSVTLAATSPLTSLDVRIYRGDGTVMLDLTLSDFVQPANDGNGLSGTWTVKTPIT